MRNILFTDDAVLVQSDIDLESLQNLANCEMTKITDWLTANKLLLNFSETKYMLITNKHVSTESFKINANGNNIERTLIYKYCVIHVYGLHTCVSSKQMC